MREKKEGEKKRREEGRERKKKGETERKEKEKEGKGKGRKKLQGPAPRVRLPPSSPAMQARHTRWAHEATAAATTGVPSPPHPPTMQAPGRAQAPSPAPDLVSSMAQAVCAPAISLGGNRGGTCTLPCNTPD